MLKGSFTVEASVLFPMLIFMYILMINTGIHYYVEIREQKEQEAQEDVWVVEEFYKYQLLKGVVHDK